MTSLHADLPGGPGLSLELPLWQAGLAHVAGLDEAGRGAWAGPVSAAAVVLPPEPGILARLAGVRDSKCMTPRQRETWAGRIRAAAVTCGVGFAGSLEIEEIGIIAATRLAMQRALAALAVQPNHLLLDALLLPEELAPQTCLYKGETVSLSIAAASVLAKTARDALMTALDAQLPGYGFARHKGYGTSEHQACLHRLGPCSIHRRSYAPVQRWQALEPGAPIPTDLVPN